MTAKLVLSLTGQQFGLEFVTSGLWSRTAPSRVLQVQDWLSLPDLQQKLTQAIQELSLSGVQARGAIFEVLLGQKHARIGLLPLDTTTQELLNGKAGAAFVHAWVKQRLHMDPATQVVRWNVLPSGRSALVTCIASPVLNLLTEFSAQAKLRFISCKPAITQLLDERDRHGLKSTQPDALTVICTEGFEAGRRSNAVQCLRFEGRQLTSAWRGWVPGSGPVHESKPLQGVVRRFQLVASPQDSEPTMHWHWPATPTASNLEEVR